MKVVGKELYSKVYSLSITYHHWCLRHVSVQLLSLFSR